VRHSGQKEPGVKNEGEERGEVAVPFGADPDAEQLIDGGKGDREAGPEDERVKPGDEVAKEEKPVVLPEPVSVAADEVRPDRDEQMGGEGELAEAEQGEAFGPTERDPAEGRERRQEERCRRQPDSSRPPMVLAGGDLGGAEGES